MGKITFTDLHLHTEFSLKDGKIRVADHDDPTRVKEEIILNAERRNTGAVTATDHGNMYGQAMIAKVAQAFGLKHIPGCEFYIAPNSRHDKMVVKGSPNYWHICAWAKNKEGYRNMCILQDLAYSEGFYYQPRIDREIIDKYGDGIIWSDACMGGTISGPILNDDMDGAYEAFMWYLNRFKDDFYIEYQNHGIPEEERANRIKIDWANKHGVPIIATIDSHFAYKNESNAHRSLLCMQYGNWLDNPMFEGFGGDGYWLLDEDELLERFPIEWLNNTQLIVDKVEDRIIEFGKVSPPLFQIPSWFKEE